MAEFRIFNDIIFKIVFGAEHSEPMLKALLNALLGYTGDNKIIHLDIQNPGLDKNFALDKGSILDLKATDSRNQQYNIEVQLQTKEGRHAYLNRSLYYWAKLFSKQVVAGQDYTELKKTISLSILDYSLFPNSTELHKTYQIFEVETKEEFPSLLELHYLELQKFSLDKPHELRTPFEKWLYILKFSHLYSELGTELPENLREEEGISTAIETYQKVIAQDDVREMLYTHKKNRMDHESRLALARSESLEEGLERDRVEERARSEAERKQAELFAQELRTPFEKWLYILKFSHLYSEPGTELPENLREEEGISTAIEMYQKALAQDHVRQMIYRREKNRKDHESGLAWARSKGLKEGLKQGIEQGVKQGIEQGVKQGIEQERVSTEAERKRAEQEAKRAERLEQQLRELGIEPEVG